MAVLEAALAIPQITMLDSEQVVKEITVEPHSQQVILKAAVAAVVLELLVATVRLGKVAQVAQELHPLFQDHQ
jgi:hypothetical protein